MTVGIVDMDPDAAITRPVSHHYGDTAVIVDGRWGAPISEEGIVGAGE
mgnify:CR=1